MIGGLVFFFNGGFLKKQKAKHKKQKAKSKNQNANSKKQKAKSKQEKTKRKIKKQTAKKKNCAPNYQKKNKTRRNASGNSPK